MFYGSTERTNAFDHDIAESGLDRS